MGVDVIMKSKRIIHISLIGILLTTSIGMLLNPAEASSSRVSIGMNGTPNYYAHLDEYEYAGDNSWISADIIADLNNDGVVEILTRRGGAYGYSEIQYMGYNVDYFIGSSDLDNDGIKESVLINTFSYYYTTHGEILIFNETALEWCSGDICEGGEETWDGWNGARIGDVDGDGLDEIVTITDKGGHIFGYNGVTYVQEWNGPMSEYPCYIDDVDNDGIEEIITIKGMREICVYGYNGSSYTQEWSYSGLGWSVDSGSVAVGDIDNDNLKEIIMLNRFYENGTDYSQFYVFKYNGVNYSQVWESDIFTGWAYIASVKDVDGDGFKEMIANTGFGYNGYRTARIFGYNDTAYTEENNFSLYGYISDVEDIDGGGCAEILVSYSNSHYVSIYGYDGNQYVKKWTSSELGWMSKELSVYIAGTGDVDGDGYKDLIVDGGYLCIFSIGKWPVPRLKVFRGYKNELVHFDASASFYYRNWAITNYFFDFGDGTNSSWVSTPNVTHYYSDYGTYDIKLKVRNVEGYESIQDDCKVITFRLEARPSVTPTSIYLYDMLYLNKSFLFNGSDSIGNISYYFFDFGDGNVSGWVNSSVITHKYLDFGVYHAKLKVKDVENIESNWSNITISVTHVPNQPPTSSISANPVVVEIGQPITFDGSESYDLYSLDWKEEGNVTEYFFDFGDGSDSGWTTHYSKSHLYMTSGVYTVTLKVKDNDGAISDSAYVMVIVGQPSTPGNQLPVVDAGSDVTVYENEPVLFDGSANDIDGYIIYYQWDFDGDGGYDWNSTKTGATVHGYAMNGTYYAELRVYDNQGGFSTGTRKITVKEGHAQTVTSSGGTVEYNNTIIIVPEGTVTQNVTFIITKISIEQPSGYILIGDVCRIETDVTSFAQPMTLILSYNESNLPAGVGEDDLAIYKKIGNDWVKLDSIVDKTNNTVSTVVTGFSDYAILYKKPSAGSETYEIPWLYIVISVIIIIALIGAGVGIKKKTAGKVKKSTIKISCPSCKTMFEVEEQERPFGVKCPKCGKEGMIK